MAPNCREMWTHINFPGWKLDRSPHFGHHYKINGRRRRKREKIIFFFHIKWAPISPSSIPLDLAAAASGGGELAIGAFDTHDHHDDHRPHFWIKLLLLLPPFY